MFQPDSPCDLPQSTGWGAEERRRVQGGGVQGRGGGRRGEGKGARRGAGGCGRKGQDQGEELPISASDIRLSAETRQTGQRDKKNMPGLQL